MNKHVVSEARSLSASRYQNVVLPATAGIVKLAIENSALTPENAPRFVESISLAIAKLAAQPGFHDADVFTPNLTSAELPRELKDLIETVNAPEPVKTPALTKAVSTIVSEAQASAEPVVQKRKVGRPKKVAAQAELPLQSPPPSISATPLKIASPARAKDVGPSPSTSSVATARMPEVSSPSLGTIMKRRKADIEPRPKSSAKLIQAPPETSMKLPKGITSINQTVFDEHIVCLEDGRKVKDLEKHLEGSGISMDAYLKKWGLPSDYPRRAPRLTLTRGVVREYDPATDRFVEI